MHHKFVVIDFDKPTARVYFGSYNFSIPADKRNGENLLVIHDRRVAVSYTVEALRIFDHYHFRVVQKEARKAQKKLLLAKPPRKPGEKPWFDEDYTDPRKVRDRELSPPPQKKNIFAWQGLTSATAATSRDRKRDQDDQPQDVGDDERHHAIEDGRYLRVLDHAFYHEDVHADRRVDEPELDRHHDDDAEPDRVEAELLDDRKMIGTVRMIMASASMRHPSTRYISMISVSTP